MRWAPPGTFAGCRNRRRARPTARRRPLQPGRLAPTVCRRHRRIEQQRPARRCAGAGRPESHRVGGSLGSLLPLRRSAQKTTAFEWGGGQAEAVAPFRARHARTRHGPVPAQHRRRASRAKPCPTPQPRPGDSTGGWRATRQRQGLPAGRARATPGSRDPVSAASKPCATKPGLWGRAGRGARGAEEIAATARSLAVCSRAQP